MSYSTGLPRSCDQQRRFNIFARSPAHAHRTSYNSLIPILLFCFFIRVVRTVL